MTASTRPRARRRRTPQRRFYDPTPSRVALDAAATYPQMDTALAQFAADYGIDVVFVTTGTGDYTGLTTDRLPQIRGVAKQVVDMLAFYPPAVIRDLTNFTFLRFVGAITSGAVAYVQSGTEMVLSTTVDTTTSAGRYYYHNVVHHEIQHVLDGAHPTAVNAQTTAWQALNPSGFTYGGPVDFGNRPAGFTTGYAVSNIVEDRAEIHCWSMVPHQYWATKAIAAAEPGVAGKINLMRSFWAARSPTLGTDLYKLAAGDTSP